LWEQVDLILLTHGDPDHAEYAPHVARASGAPIVCGLELMNKWQKRGLTAIPIAPGETVEAAGVSVSGVPARHGGLPLTLFGHAYTFKPKFVGAGAVGLLFNLDNCRLLNLGDTLYLEDAWCGLRPDLLMVPIGGMMTMDVDEALQAVAVIEPRVVIPMHYNWHLLFYHRPADVSRFAAGVRELGSECIVLDRGESYAI
ncbi:MAG: MBL fold metallo-hydrolase, partial [Anaerolineales bacterium]